MPDKGVRNLPQFSGDSHDWLMFSTQFKHSTAVCGYKYYKNLLRLKKSLKGRARETVAGLLSLPENVPVIVVAVQRRFGHPDLIIFDMIQKISQMTNEIIIMTPSLIYVTS